MRRFRRTFAETITRKGRLKTRMKGNRLTQTGSIPPISQVNSAKGGQKLVTACSSFVVGGGTKGHVEKLGGGGIPSRRHEKRRNERVGNHVRMGGKKGKGPGLSRGQFGD